MKYDYIFVRCTDCVFFFSSLGFGFTLSDLIINDQGVSQTLFLLKRIILFSFFSL